MSRSQFNSYWFTNQTGGKVRLRSCQDFSDFFWHQLYELRQVYQLQPDRFGQDSSIFLRPVLARDKKLFAMLQNLEWSHLRQFNDVGVQLVFEVRLALFTQQGLSQLGGATEFAEALNVPFTLFFPTNYPQDRPNMLLNHEKLRPEWQRSNSFNYMLSEDILCVMNNPQAEWVRGKSANLVTCIDCLVDWMAANLSPINHNA